MKVNKICGIWPRRPQRPNRCAKLHNLIQRANINTELQRDRRPRDELLLRGFHFILRLLAQDGRNIPMMHSVNIGCFILQRKLPQMRHDKLRLLP